MKQPIIYTASKTKHAHKWQFLRSLGWNINSTWIDEAGANESDDLSDLAIRCVKEVMTANQLILYCEDGEILKGGLIEFGIALGVGTPVLIVGEAE